LNVRVLLGPVSVRVLPGPHPKILKELEATTDNQTFVKDKRSLKGINSLK